MGLLFQLCIYFVALMVTVDCLTNQETCDLCQLVIRTVNGHFSTNVSSRRKLANQLKHECNRQFNYRRRCLVMIKENAQLLYQEMNTPSFKPLTICLLVKECTPYTDPNAVAIPQTGETTIESL
ncbi:unnamed protein product [Auanema sp. JU1783]|nr:unnamed protein product [Auanema sp. JU1783]